MSRDEILGLLIEQYEKDISLEFERGKRLEDKGHSLFGFDISTLAVLAGLFTVGQTLTTGTGLGTFSFVLIVYAIAVGFFVIATLLTMACFRVTTIKHAEGSTSLDDVNEELKCDVFSSHSSLFGGDTY